MATQWWGVSKCFGVLHAGCSARIIFLQEPDKSFLYKWNYVSNAILYCFQMFWSTSKLGDNQQ